MLKPAVLFSAAAMMLSATAAPSLANEKLEGLTGAWRGTGTISPSGPGGASERISCKANYKVGEGAATIVQSLNCTGTDYRLNATSNVRNSGGKLSGSWEANLANGDQTSGSAGGEVSGDSVSIALTSPVFQGRVGITLADKDRHSVTIRQLSAQSGNYETVGSISFRR